MSRHASCLVAVSCVLSLSDIDKCLFCVETLAFLAESRPMPIYSLFATTVKRCTCACCFMAIMCLDNCTLATSQPQAF